MKPVTRSLLFGALGMALGALAYSQSTWHGIRWHWWLCGEDRVNGRYISTYTTGKEVVMCDEIFSSSSIEGYAQGEGNSATVSCVLIKGGDK